MFEKSLDFVNNMVKENDLIRKVLVCIFNLDILYNELSVEEHLDLIGKVDMIEKRYLILPM
jgi:ABC-type multidrug transport system ATPase subunit